MVIQKALCCKVSINSIYIYIERERERISHVRPTKKEFWLVGVSTNRSKNTALFVDAFFRAYNHSEGDPKWGKTNT